MGDLNIGKQMDKQGRRRHCDPLQQDAVAKFFTGMGVRVKMKAAKNGQQTDGWFKASVFAEMVFGSAKFPGGAAAWVPSLVLLIGNLKLEERDRVARTLGDVPRAAQNLTGRPLQEMMNEIYGQSLASTLLLILRGYDKYRTWRRIMDEPCESDAEKADNALRFAIAGALPVTAGMLARDCRHACRVLTFRRAHVCSGGAHKYLRPDGRYKW